MIIKTNPFSAQLSPSEAAFLSFVLDFEGEISLEILTLREVKLLEDLYLLGVIG